MSKEYIEREAALKAMSQAIQDRTWSMDDFDVMMKMEDYVQELPAADVEPIRHGHWTGMEGDECSECRRNLTEIMDADSYFAIGFNPNDLVACPFCGAKMDGGNKNE